jgi:hypothetical protein
MYVGLFIHFWYISGIHFFGVNFKRVCSDLGVLQLHMKCLPFLVGLFFVSQGGAMAALLAALVRSTLRSLPSQLPLMFSRLKLERPHLYPPFLIDGKTPHPPLYVTSSFCFYPI